MQTYGEQFKSALKCKTVGQAKKWLDKEVEELAKEPTCKFKRKEEIKNAILSNLGYMAGYYDKETSEKIYKLFSAEHPVFGKPEYWDSVTPEIAFNEGRRTGEKEKN